MLARTSLSDSSASSFRQLRFAGASALAAALTAITVPLSAADDGDGIVPLDAIVVSATRTPQEVTAVASSVTSLALADFADAQIGDLRGALATVPGMVIATSGARGGQTSVFLRGASSHQVLFFVDGVRMNDRSAAYFNFLGGADLAGLDRAEVLRGPQSTLYGSSALGGVILLETARGRGANSGALALGGGSFGTLGGTLAGQGTHGALGYAAAFGYTRTENDLPRNDFDQWSAAGRLESRVGDALVVGATARVQHSNYQEPGSRFFASEADIDSDNTLLTTYAEWNGHDQLRSRLTYGWHARDYRYHDTWGTSDSRNRRDVLDWQNTWTATPNLEVVAGANAEWSRYDIADWRTKDRVLAGYASGTFALAEHVVFNAGVRHDDYRSAGAATTGRAGVAWRLPDNATKLRATYGTGFSAPGTDDRFGVPQWGQLANPDLRPEESRGWDVGVDHAFVDQRVEVGVTYFRNTFRDLFEYEIVDFTMFTGRTVNRARARADGIETVLTVRPHDALTLAASYTYLDAINADTGARLTRRPRHTADVDVRVRPSRAWLVGAGAHLVADGIDGGTTVPDYTTMRVYARWTMRDGVALHLRIENALNKTYEEVLGYAALPRAAYGGAEWRF